MIPSPLTHTCIQYTIIMPVLKSYLCLIPGRCHKSWRCRRPVRHQQRARAHTHTHNPNPPPHTQARTHARAHKRVSSWCRFERLLLEEEEREQDSKTTLPNKCFCNNLPSPPPLPHPLLPPASSLLSPPSPPPKKTISSPPPHLTHLDPISWQTRQPATMSQT